MLGWFESIVLGIVQGLTEFLPVSSSGHLVVVPAIFGWKQPSLTFDLVLHFGTLLAVIFVQGVLIEGLRFLGDWRNLLFGALIVLAMNVRPAGFLGGARRA